MMMSKKTFFIGDGPTQTRIYLVIFTHHKQSVVITYIHRVHFVPKLSGRIVSSEMVNLDEARALILLYFRPSARWLVVGIRKVWRGALIGYSSPPQTCLGFGVFESSQRRDR